MGRNKQIVKAVKFFVARGVSIKFMDYFPYLKGNVAGLGFGGKSFVSIHANGVVEPPVSATDVQYYGSYVSEGSNVLLTGEYRYTVYEPSLEELMRVWDREVQPLLDRGYKAHKSNLGEYQLVKPIVTDGYERGAYTCTYRPTPAWDNDKPQFSMGEVKDINLLTVHAECTLEEFEELCEDMGKVWRNLGDDKGLQFCLSTLSNKVEKTIAFYTKDVLNVTEEEVYFLRGKILQVINEKEYVVYVE